MFRINKLAFIFLAVCSQVRGFNQRETPELLDNLEFSQDFRNFDEKAALPSRQTSTPTALDSCECGRRKSSRIVGGDEAADNEFPFAVKLLHFGGFFCGGTLVSNRFVLTAAHCTRGKRAEQLKVLLGVNYEGQKGGLTLQVLRIIDHPNNNKYTNDNDFSLLKIDEIDFDSYERIRPACLPTANRNYEQTNATAIGWGLTSEDGAPSYYLRSVVVPVTSQSACRKAYSSNDITDNMICAGAAGKDACQGDSGGAMLHKHVHGGYYDVIGVTSFGRGCGQPGSPGIYARVTAVKEWIAKEISQSSICRTPS